MSEWLGVSETAKMLGVHPNTVRKWADLGRIPVHRTEGSHRRFRREDIELWLESQRGGGSADANLVAQRALWHTRFHISEGELEKEAWYQKIDARGREKYSKGGQETLRGLENYLTNHDARSREEVINIGKNYAFWAFRNGLSSADATRAFIFFRGLLLKSMLEVYEHTAIRPPQAWVEMFRKINEFSDQVIGTMLDSFEEYDQRGGQGQE